MSYLRYKIRIIAAVLSVVILAIGIAAVTLVNNDLPQTENHGPSRSLYENESSSYDNGYTDSGSSEKGFIKGAWIPYMSLDLKGTDRSEKAALDKLSQLFDKVKKDGCNTVLIHVRPFGDALYKSKIFPASHVISGEQGKNVSYDFLSIAVKTAKERGLKIHAWINPLRVCTSSTPQSLSDDNPYVKWQNDNDTDNDRYCFKSGDNVYYDPAYPEVRKLIVDGVREIVRNYDVDGVVIDDYFYPENDMKCDSYEYDMYCKSAGLTYLSQINWRKGNINSLVSSIYSAVHFEKKGCLFGISPQCNMENDEKISADISSWAAVKGYADYISPQIYVSEYHPVLPFEKSLRQWRELVTQSGIKLYISLALYKDGTDADEGTWLKKKTNIPDQIKLCEKYKTDGVILYSY